VKNWRAKPAIAEANEVPEQDSWRAEGEAPNKALVARAEALLDKLGYDIGAADGEAGARTREAIKAFELRNGRGHGAARHQARAARWLASPEARAQGAGVTLK
jgi:hypothetical protein